MFSNEATEGRSDGIEMETGGWKIAISRPLENGRYIAP